MSTRGCEEGGLYERKAQAVSEGGETGAAAKREREKGGRVNEALVNTSGENELCRNYYWAVGEQGMPQ